jgi:hypothetical protein
VVQAAIIKAREWVRLVEAVRLFRSRAKGFARCGSDIRDDSDKCSVLLFERPAETHTGIERPTSSQGQSN